MATQFTTGFPLGINVIVMIVMSLNASNTIDKMTPNKHTPHACPVFREF